MQPSGVRIPRKCPLRRSYGQQNNNRRLLIITEGIDLTGLLIESLGFHRNLVILKITPLLEAPPKGYIDESIMRLPQER